MTNKIQNVFIVATIIILSLITAVSGIAGVDYFRKGESVIPATDLEKETQHIDHAAIIDKYFKDRGMPLAGYGKDCAYAADIYSIDGRLLPAISVIESTGGKFMCGNNPFGWGSCRSGVGDFDSISEAIDYVSMNLGGMNPHTRSAYSGDSRDDLWSYNGTVDRTYPDRVMRVMTELMDTPLPRS